MKSGCKFEKTYPERSSIHFRQKTVVGKCARSTEIISAKMIRSETHCIGKGETESSKTC